MKSIKQKYYDIFESTELLFYFLKEDQSKLSFEIPDTIFYKGGFPDVWYYMENGKIKSSQSFKEINLNYISTKCIETNSKQSIVSGVFFIEQSNKIVKNESSNVMEHSKCYIYINISSTKYYY